MKNPEKPARLGLKKQVFLNPELSVSSDVYVVQICMEQA